MFGPPMDAPEPPPLPLCFVLMPFGKDNVAGQLTNFNSVYEKVIAPGVKQAGLDPIRADEERVGGAIHKPMFERLLLCEYAIADLTGANPNVYYELGVRHARRRPTARCCCFAKETKLPFDIALLRGMFYNVDGNGSPTRPPSPRPRPRSPSSSRKCGTTRMTTARSIS